MDKLSNKIWCFRNRNPTKKWEDLRFENSNNKCRWFYYKRNYCRHIRYILIIRRNRLREDIFKLIDLNILKKLS